MAKKHGLGFPQRRKEHKANFIFFFVALVSLWDLLKYYATKTTLPNIIYRRY